MEFHHYSVLLNETIENLNIRPDGIYVDGTLGGGGHSYQILKRLGENGRLIGIDQDGERLAEFGNKATLIRSNYANMKEELHAIGVNGVDGIVLDLGVSSFQLDTPERGFTYREPDAPLDMRMDDRQSQTAKDIVNGYSEMDLYRIIRDYGEDKFAKNIAKHIVKERQKKTIETAGELTDIIRAAIPMKVQVTGGHPAKRTFQAIRIELNHELEVLSDHLDEMIDLLNPGGRICIITFHSLEDRIVKSNFKRNENPCTCPSDFPVCVGNTVRRMEAVPDYRRERREREEREREEQLRRRKRQVRRNQERQLRMSKRYVVFLTMAVTVFGVFAGTYIKIQSDMTARMNTISSLESQIADLKADNDEAYKRIRMSVDLDSVREKALNELGMSYAKESQIIYYTVDNDDFMNQYSEIPQK